MQKKFYLSQSDKKIGGVCGGLAEYFDVDPFMVRLVVFLAVFVGGLSLWIYILIWLLAPKRA
jgi:phage shock protein PspC (stress-responsive transcriptional regulator)